MHSRSRLIGTGLGVLLLVLLLIPLTGLLSLGQDDAAHDAEHVVMPMLELLAASPQAQAHMPVEPMLELEDAWAIEDERSEAEHALVAGMRNGADELGYDSESRTFYCTLGMDGGEDWPELKLYAQAADGENLRVAWIDDYSYDYRSDAIREGWRYELLAYTDTAYEYIGVVFTGLPIVTLHVHGGVDALGETYTPARAAISGAGYEAVNTAAQVHLRGGGYLPEYPKFSFRLEFYGMSEKNSLEKNPQSVLGMEPDSDWLLIGNVTDDSRVRNHMSWKLWSEWNADGQAFALLDSEMVEVFANDEYLGLYQLMQRVDADEEIVRMGGNLNTDVAMRIIAEMNIEDRPYVNLLEECGYFAELRYKPQSMSDETAMSVFDSHHMLNVLEKENGYADDAEFAQAALAHTDMRELLEYFVFAQAVSFGHDNVFNNVYLWALKDGDSYIYYFSPWDMDRMFEPVYAKDPDQINLWYPQVCRLLELNISGAREILWEIWNEKKDQFLHDDALYQRFMDMEDMINASGAYRRDTLKWMGEERTLEMTKYSAYARSHRDSVEFYFKELWPLDGMQ